MNEINIDLFHEDLLANNFDGLWRIAPKVLTKAPTDTGVPYVWRWDEAIPRLMKAGDVIDPAKGGERRVLLLVNPALKGGYGTTHSLTASLQLIKPGEIAPAHRHTPNAIRFIIEGNGGYTTVNGERVVMNEGDLTLTPAWMWHDHGNQTDHNIIWLDGIDASLTTILRGMFFQPYTEPMQPVTRDADHSRRLVGTGTMRPVRRKLDEGDYLPLIYRFEQAYDELQAQKKKGGDPHDGVYLEYLNPVTGGSALRTVSCYLQLLRSGEHTQAHRHASSTVYFVFRGEGYSVIDGKKYAWKRGDTFCVPVWALHEHVNTAAKEETILFSYSDEPLMRAVGLYREEAYAENSGHQRIAA
ncbi:MAG TPA: cupin domain-containing protein [Acidiferrobacterales bacterium]|nr:cupin domain-containing protein [Acidiferrobacterales bacterium]